MATTAVENPTTNGTLTLVRERAVHLRDSATELVDLVDKAMTDAPRELEARMEDVKRQILLTLGADIAVERAKPARRTSTAVSAPRSVRGKGSSRFACDICKAEGKKYYAKNDAGLAIHKGRQHGRKAEREATPATTEGQQESVAS